MKKKILSALAVLTAVSLVSCGKPVKKTGTAEVGSPDYSQAEGSNDAQADNEEKEDIVITIALAAEPEPGEFDEFNNADNGMRIEYVVGHYNQDENGDVLTYTTDELQKTDFDLIQRIINKNDIDIVGAFSFCNPAYYEILKNKGAFVDLYDYMKDDAEVDPELMNKHVLDLCEIDGHLYGLPYSYKVHTLTGKKEYVGETQNWTVDEFLEHWNAMPDNTHINGSRNAENIYYLLLRSNLTSYVDYAKAEVYFDSPDFRKLLEFCGSFPSNNGEKSDLDYNTPQFVQECNITGFMGADQYRDYTFVGYPDSNRNGTYITTVGEYSICAHSSDEKKRAAWEYIRRLYTEEYQQDHVVQKYEYNIDGKTTYGFSPECGFLINNNARKTTAERVCNCEYANPTYEVKGVVYETPLPSLEDCENFEKYVDSINRIDMEIDRKLFEIIQEEITAYLGGDQDIDRTIELIQNRTAIMVSERS